MLGIMSSSFAPNSFGGISVSSARHSSGVGTEVVYNTKSNTTRNALVFLQQRHDWNLDLNGKETKIHCDYKLWVDFDRKETLEGFDLDNFEKLNLYAEHMFGDVRVKLGNQEVTWGESPMITILDLVNPRNLSHPRGFYDPASKIPQFMANIEWQKDKMSYQLIAIPIPETIRQPEEVLDLNVAPSKPFTSLADGEYGARIGILENELDTKVYFLHHWPRVPSYRFTPWSGAYDLEAADKPQETVGASTSYANANWIARADLAYHNNYPAINIGTEIERSGLTQGILGTSWTTDQLHTFGSELHFDLWEKAPSAYSDTAFVGEKRGIQDIYWMGFNASFNLWNQLLEPQVMYLKGINKQDEALRLIAIWNATDHLEVVGEYQKTDGDSGSPKLLLNRRDTLSLRLTWTF